jgi:TM2 domain-containing membrane protein YozV
MPLDRRTPFKTDRRLEMEQTVSTGGSTEKIRGRRNFAPAFFLVFFLGWFGAHRFYVGKIGTAVLMLITFGGAGVWWLYDLILIVTDNFTDRDGGYLTIDLGSGERGPYRFDVTVLLLVFAAGMHRFYVGKIGTGVLFLLSWLTVIGGFIWLLIDLIKLGTDRFTDSHQRLLRRD